LTYVLYDYDYGCKHTFFIDKFGISALM